MTLSNTNRPLVLVVAAAVIRDDGSILLAQRPAGKSMAGLWELPGGKIEPGETPEEALSRELEEELGMNVQPNQLTPLTFASHRYEKFHLLMPVFLCREWQGQPTPQEGQSLAWVHPDNLADYPAPDADIPLFAFLKAWTAAEV